MHFTAPSFWEAYGNLPEAARKSADRSYELLKDNPRHPSLQFKKVGRYWSARAGLGFRALAVKAADGFVWFWIGTHEEYDRLVK
jgi:hypothetical protein